MIMMIIEIKIHDDDKHNIEHVDDDTYDGNDDDDDSYNGSCYHDDFYKYFNKYALNMLFKIN